MRIRDPEWKKFGSGMEKIRIRDKNPETATLRISMRISNSLVTFQLPYTDPHPEKLYPKPAEMLKNRDRNK
jgi:hypothetical protein